MIDGTWYVHHRGSSGDTIPNPLGIFKGLNLASYSASKIVSLSNDIPRDSLLQVVLLVLVPEVACQSFLVIVYDAGACVDVKVLQTNISVVAFHDLSFVDV